MTFTDYLNTKKKFLIYYFLFHSFALFVNVFLIEGKISEYTNLLTRENFSISGDTETKHFWPIVKYVDSFYDGSSYFNGIFYHYDISEFLGYSVLIFVALYFYYENKPSSFKG